MNVDLEKRVIAITMHVQGGFMIRDHIRSVVKARTGMDYRIMIFRCILGEQEPIVATNSGQHIIVGAGWILKNMPYVLELAEIRLAELVLKGEA